VLTTEGNIPVVGTVYDKREYYSHHPQTIEVLPYSVPSIEPHSGDSSVICERSTASGEPKDSGTYLHIRAKRKYDPVTVNGVQKNFCDLQYRYKIEGGGWYSPVTILSGSDTATDEVDVVLPNIVTQTDKSYLVQLIVTDTMGANEPDDYPIGTDIVTLHLKKGGRGAAFGKYSEGNDLLECAWDFAVDGEAAFNHIARRDKYDGFDFNDLIYHTGYYTSSKAPGLAECSNYPENVMGVLGVISHMIDDEGDGSWWGFAVQTYITRTGVIYTRCYYSTVGWTDWKTITTS
jgi:hypothetical protein